VVFWCLGGLLVGRGWGYLALCGWVGVVGVWRCCYRCFLCFVGGVFCCDSLFCWFVGGGMLVVWGFGGVGLVWVFGVCGVCGVWLGCGVFVFGVGG